MAYDRTAAGWSDGSALVYDRMPRPSWAWHRCRWPAAVLDAGAGTGLVAR